MKKTSAILPAAVLALALAACQREDPNNFAIDEVNHSASADVELLPPSEEAGPPASSNSGTTLNEAEGASQGSNRALIPAQYRGRWGMVAADCTPGRSDTKGLMTIGGTSISFYESVGTLKEQRPAIATSFSGRFGFTGEGMTWEKMMTFTRTGNSLKRADEEGSYSYTRC